MAAETAKLDTPAADTEIVPEPENVAVVESDPTSVNTFVADTANVNEPEA